MKKTLACTLGVFLGAVGSIPATGAFAQGVPVFDATALANHVITSYSIHYTKLYEIYLELLFI